MHTDRRKLRRTVLRNNGINLDAKGADKDKDWEEDDVLNPEEEAQHRAGEALEALYVR